MGMIYKCLQRERERRDAMGKRETRPKEKKQKKKRGTSGRIQRNEGIEDRKKTKGRGADLGAVVRLRDGLRRAVGVRGQHTNEGQAAVLHGTHTQRESNSTTNEHRIELAPPEQRCTHTVQTLQLTCSAKSIP